MIERYSYDAWGLRRNPTTWAAATISAYEPRGYTGHEHLDDIGIIHMNGRVYEPRLGRMLSPDPVTQAPENGQNYNRYTYANNNPLGYTDPSGFEAATIGGFIANTVVNSLVGAAIGKLFGGDSGCGRNCQYRRQANAWCSTNDACSRAQNNTSKKQGLPQS